MQPIAQHYTTPYDDQLRHLNEVTLAVLSTTQTMFGLSCSDAIVVLAVHHGRMRGLAYSVSSLMSLTGLPRSTVRASLDRLEQTGWVMRMRRDGKVYYYAQPDGFDPEALVPWLQQVGRLTPKGGEIRHTGR
jgi:DNA-binding transcriptional ArsR family regulator